MTTIAPTLYAFADSGSTKYMPFAFNADMMSVRIAGRAV